MDNFSKLSVIKNAVFSPGVFNKAWWSGQVLDWAMKDPDFKTEMFRFVDVFPVLDTPEEINRHIQEYLLQPGLKVPTVIKMALKGAGLGKLAMRMASGQIAKNLEGMAKNFKVKSITKLPIKNKYLTPLSLKLQLSNFRAKSSIGEFNK